MEGPVIAAISSFLFVDIATGSQVVGYYHDDIVLTRIGIASPFAGSRCIRCRRVHHPNRAQLPR